MNRTQPEIALFGVTADSSHIHQKADRKVETGLQSQITVVELSITRSTVEAAASEAAEMHALTHRHHFGLVDEETERLDGQLVFELELLAVESLEALLGLVEPHLQVLDDVLDGQVGLDEAGLRLVAAQLDARSARAVLQASLDQLERDDSLLDSLAKVRDVIFHLCNLLLHLHAAPLY